MNIAYNYVNKTPEPMLTLSTIYTSKPPWTLDRYSVQTAVVTVSCEVTGEQLLHHYKVSHSSFCALWLMQHQQMHYCIIYASYHFRSFCVFRLYYLPFFREILVSATWIRGDNKAETFTSYVKEAAYRKVHLLLSRTSFIVTKILEVLASNQELLGGHKGIHGYTAGNPCFSVCSGQQPHTARYFFTL